MTVAALSATTQLVGLIGWPVSHSVSPAMHNAAFAALGLDWAYVPLPVNPAGRAGDAAVAAAVRGLAALGLRGANVTIPHKQAVMAAVDQLTPAAAAIGAVNTLLVGEDGTLIGDNTDAPGFVADLRAHGVEPAGMHGLVLGAGGSARAIIYGLAEAGAAAITVLNRTPERAQALVVALQPLFPQVAITAGPLPVTAEQAARATLIVNCTQAGMTPQPETTPWPETVAFQPGQIVYDLVYNPPVTRLLQQAEAGGARAIGGLGMLIWQGALAFARWTGLEPPVAVMRRAAETALHRRGALPTPGAAVTVRRAQSADADAISALNAQVLQLHAAARPDFFKTPSDATFPPALAVEWMARPDLFFFVAEVEGQVVGYLMVELGQLAEGASTRALKRANIHHLVVAQSARRQGAGAALLRTARTWAQDNGADLVVLEVWAFNAAAQRFFAGQGFAPFTHRLVWAGEDDRYHRQALFAESDKRGQTQPEPDERSGAFRPEPKPAAPRGETHLAINQGDIYWVQVAEPGESEPGILHPYAVVQDNILNHSRIHTVVVCALTSNLKRANEPGNVLLDAGEANLPKQSVVEVSKVSTVAKAQLGEYIGSLGELRIKQILAGMRFLQRSYFAH